MEQVLWVSPEVGWRQLPELGGEGLLDPTGTAEHEPTAPTEALMERKRLPHSLLPREQGPWRTCRQMCSKCCQDFARVMEENQTGFRCDQVSFSF
jgi:hypothetical protein